MGEKKLTIPVSLNANNAYLTIYSESPGDTLIEKLDASENGEAFFQIKEGCYYEYKIMPEGFSLATNEIVSQSKLNESSGRISPNTYVGTLSIEVLDSEKNKCGEIRLEVQSVKTTYREDYRHMLEEITERCTELLLQFSSPTSQYFEVNFYADAKTMYQRFAFINSILGSAEFNDSIHKIISTPVTCWKEVEFNKNISGVKRFNNSTIRQVASASNRTNIPTSHPLKKFQSIPSKIKQNDKTETVDTPENRFVKHALFYFQSFCGDFKSKLQDNSRVMNEVGLLIDKLDHFLSYSIFKEVSIPKTLPLNSPVLQRKEGYREILRVWLMFDLASKLVWHGGDDVYSGNKRDVAVLYEYWVFFKLLDIIKEVFKIDSLATIKMIEQTKDGLGLKLKQGRFLPIEGVHIGNTRKLRVEFSYNKTFNGDTIYPNGGSWTKNLRPDYTLSIWPDGIDRERAEIEELIVHIHFDAKYKIENLKYLFEESNLEEEKEEQKKGTYKRVDLLKMHTYKDAIRRTAGSYILYPGTEDIYIKKGFHELIPGLGAFALRPSKSNDGSKELKKFLIKVVAHFLNRTSQREKISLQTFVIHKDKPSRELNEILPETYGINRNLIPDNTSVLIAYYKDEAHLNWITRKLFYNARTGSKRGSLRLTPRVMGAKYILLHTSGETKTNKLFKLRETGPRIFSKQDMIDLEYPSLDPGPYYLVFDLEAGIEMEFQNKKWDITKLEEYSNGRNSALAFTVSLSDLMQVLVKK